MEKWHVMRANKAPLGVKKRIQPRYIYLFIMRHDLNIRVCAALGSILTLMCYDPQYRPLICQNVHATLGSILFGAQKIFCITQIIGTTAL